MLLHLREQAERDRRYGRRVITGTMAEAMEFSAAVHGDFDSAERSRRAPSPMRFEKREIAAPSHSFGVASVGTETGIGNICA
ncbi:hypothetical protein NMY22_g8388 [Coprinellus aureogranulatus]|nr:hypothetical protein NMY22_g8388 [Coprinellus aureogranulatus]